MEEDAIELAKLVLEWWDMHQFDVDGEYGEFNVYNETPAFVVKAMEIIERRNNEIQK